MSDFGDFENLYSKDSLEWFVKEFHIKNYDELVTLLKQPAYWSALQHHRLSTGEISSSVLHQLLTDAGYIYKNGSYIHDNRSKFGSWVMDKFGPTFAKVCASLFGGAVVNDILDDKQSATSVASATGNDIIGTGRNTGYYGDTTSSSRPSTGFFDNLLNSLFGDGSYSGSGILSALTGIGGQFASSAFNMANTEKLIDKMNEYNTPSNQMSRFADAGLNPNLIYGLGSNGNQNNAGTIAPVDFDTSQRENRMAQMQFDLAAKTAKADIAQKMSATQLNTANAAEADARRVAQENTNSLFDVIRNQEITNLNIRLQELESAKANAKTDQSRAYFSDEIAYIQKHLSELEESKSEIELGWMQNRDQTYWIDYAIDALSSLLGGFGHMRSPRTFINNNKSENYGSKHVIINNQNQ